MKKYGSFIFTAYINLIIINPKVVSKQWPDSNQIYKTVKNLSKLYTKEKMLPTFKVITLRGVKAEDVGLLMEL